MCDGSELCFDCDSAGVDDILDVLFPEIGVRGHRYGGRVPSGVHITWENTGGGCYCLVVRTDDDDTAYYIGDASGELGYSGFDWDSGEEHTFGDSPQLTWRSDPYTVAGWILTLPPFSKRS